MFGVIELSLIQAGKIQLYTQIKGEGEPCVLLHGSFVDGLFWEEQIPALSQEFKVIVPDLRGHGLSDKPQEGYSHEVMAMDIGNLLKTLDIKRVHLMGHSMGSRISLRFALDYPHLVNKLVLASGSVGPVQPRENIFSKKVQEEIGIGTPHFDLRKFNYYEICNSFTHPSSEQVNEILEKIWKTPNYVRSSIGMTFPKEDLRPKLHLIQAQTLVITGEEDVICPIKEAKYLVQNIPKAQLEIISDSGHCVPIEKPNEFNTKVLSFLKEKKLR